MSAFVTPADTPWERLFLCRDAFECRWASVVRLGDAPFRQCPACGGRLIIGRPRRWRDGMLVTRADGADEDATE